MKQRNKKQKQKQQHYNDGLPRRVLDKAARRTKGYLSTMEFCRMIAQNSNPPICVNCKKRCPFAGG